ncbi:hypothetical protein N0V90_000596 [Kalmusia sp. IMI 367209]|nr:hypothetical protein N0V90_000596 [Kalmusia sp. IMI 367209]
MDDSKHGQSSVRSGSSARRSTKKVQQFMFIDSSEKGVNSKPDRNVRSFVMKSARSKKPWSTRPGQKSPKEDTDPESTSPSDTKPYGPHPTWPEDLSPTTISPSWQHAAASPTIWSSNPSPVSRNSSFLSTRSRSQPYISPASPSCSLCDIPECTGDLCSQPHASNSPANRAGFAVKFTDEFDCLPVPTDYNTRELLNKYHHQTSKRQTAQWISKGIQSPTGAPFLYAIFTSSALYRQFTGSASPREVLEYKISAISEINKQLSDTRSQIDDNNIAAVFMLLCIEESAVTAKEDVEWATMQRQLHLDGLKTMINQRGGLAALNSNQCLQTFILMHSIAHAVSTFERPYTTLVDSTGNIQQYDIPSFRGRPASARILRFFHPLRLDLDLYDIISNVVVFIGDLNIWNDNIKTPVDPIEMQKHVCLLVYRLFDWYKLREECSNIDRNPVDQSICLALIIFLVIAYNQNYSIMVYAASLRLITSLENCLLFNWGNATDVLMWTLTMGGLAARHTENFDFFKRNCVMAFKAQGFNEDTNPEEVLDRMRKFLWLRKLDKDVKDVWAEMGICKGEDVVDMMMSGMKSPDRIKKEDIVGGLTNERFFGKKT